MSNQQPSSGEAESVQWITIRLQQTVRAIGAERSETGLVDLFAVRFKRMQRRRRLQRFGVGLASGTGVGFGADALFDLGLLDLINVLLDWVGRPLVLKLSDSAPYYIAFLS